MIRDLRIILPACLVMMTVACNTLPKGSRVITCKPIIHQGGVGWREGRQNKIPLSRQGSESITWPILILRNAQHTLFIHFADNRLLRKLETDQIYTFAVLPQAFDDRGVVPPKVFWVKKNGSRIYHKDD